MKKILAILCAIAMVCSLALFASAAETNETVLDVALPSGTGWQQAETMTTLWGGTLDSGFIKEGGCLKIYLTANSADLWQVRLALNGAQWTELDWHVNPADVANPVGTIVDNGDGTLVVTFNYDDIVAVYGTDDFVGTLGAIYICTNAGSDVTVTSVTYSVPGTEDEGNDVPSGGDSIAVVLALMAASAAAIVVLGKKKF